MHTPLGHEQDAVAWRALPHIPRVPLEFKGAVGRRARRRLGRQLRCDERCRSGKWADCYLGERLVIQLAPTGNQQSSIGNLTAFPDLVELLERSLADEPPANLRDGGIIRDGNSPELDELRSLSRDGKSWIAKLQEDERKRTGIESLKVKFNNVFG